MRNWLCAVVGKDRALSVASQWLSHVLVSPYRTSQSRNHWIYDASSRQFDCQLDRTLRHKQSQLETGLGNLSEEVSRPGKPAIRFEQPASLFRNRTKEISFLPNAFPDLTVHDPDVR